MTGDRRDGLEEKETDERRMRTKGGCSCPALVEQRPNGPEKSSFGSEIWALWRTESHSRGML